VTDLQEPPKFPLNACIYRCLCARELLVIIAQRATPGAWAEALVWRIQYWVLRDRIIEESRKLPMNDRGSA